METLQLHHFQTVATVELIAKAAEVLQVAHPSLSKKVTRLVKELRVPF